MMLLGAAASSCTIVLFSSPTCKPCHALLRDAPGWLARIPNLVVVGVNVGNEDGPQFELLRDMNFQGQAVPIGVLIGPLGPLMHRLKDASEIRNRVGSLGRDRHYLQVIREATDNGLQEAPIDDKFYEEMEQQQQELL